MIRPITCVTVLLAGASGLYLYQTKHRVHVLDAQIDQVVRQTAQTREQTRVLHAEWTLLDQPDRLQQLAAQFLMLQPTKPQQFAAAADLDSRLPPPLPPESEAPTPDAEALVASEAPAEVVSEPSAQTPRRETALAAERVAEHVGARPLEHPPEHLTEHAAAPTKPTRASTASPPLRAAPTRLIATVLPRPLPFYQPPAAKAAYQQPWRPQPMAAGGMPTYGGSMLGVTRAASPPPPAPAPVWTNWNR